MKPKVSQWVGVKIKRCQGVACAKVSDVIFLIFWYFVIKEKVQEKKKHFTN